MYDVKTTLTVLGVKVDQRWNLWAFCWRCALSCHKTVSTNRRLSLFRSCIDEAVSISNCLLITFLIEEIKNGITVMFSSNITCICICRIAQVETALTSDLMRIYQSGQFSQTLATKIYQTAHDCCSVVEVQFRFHFRRMGLVHIKRKRYIKENTQET